MPSRRAYCHSPTTGIRVAVREPVEDEAVKAMTRAQLARLLDELDEDWRLFFESSRTPGFASRKRSRCDGAATSTSVTGRRSSCDASTPTARSGRRSPGRPARPPALGRHGGTAARDRRAERHARLHHDHRQTAQPLNHYRDVLHPVAVRAGLPWVSFHNFRHTCASLLFAAGKNVKQVQVRLWYAGTGFTVGTYIHLMDEGLGDADFLDGVVGHRRTIQ